MDAAAWLAIIPLVAIGLWALFSVNRLPPAIAPTPPAPSPAPTPAPPILDRPRMIERVALELQEVEMHLRSGGLVQAAEGAALVRQRAISFLREYKE